MTDKTAIFVDGFASKVSKSSSLGKVCILEHVTKYGNFLSGSVIKTRGAIPQQDRMAITLLLT